jgi:regulator of replication initiation timing
MEDNDKSSLLDKARNVGERLMEVGGEISRLKTEASQAVEEGVVAARRLARRAEPPRKI